MVIYLTSYFKLMSRIQNISSTYGIWLLKLISKLSFSCLFLLSDTLFFFLYYISGYRKKVVWNNLKNSFPEKPDDELKEISRKYYKNLCDIFIESVSRFGKGKNSVEQRMDLTEIEELNRYFDEGKSIFLLSTHFGNWEWVKVFPTRAKHKTLLVYNPQRNLKYDAYINQLRSEYGADLVSTKRIYKKLLACKEDKELTLTLLVADQTPKKNSKFWCVFLNQETAYFPGPGKLVLKHPNDPVFFYYMEKTARGRYKVRIELLIENPADLTNEELLYAYSQRVEKLVRENPEYYLWSHRRWKHQRPANIPLYQPITN